MLLLSREEKIEISDKLFQRLQLIFIEMNGNQIAIVKEYEFNKPDTHQIDSINHIMVLQIVIITIFIRLNIDICLILVLQKSDIMK